MPTPRRPSGRQAPAHSTLSSVHPGESSACTARLSGALTRWTILFLALNAADGLETWWGLRLGIAERFPIYSWLFAHEGFAVAMLFKAFVILWATLFVIHTRTQWPWPGFAALCMRVLCLETALVIVVNGVSLFLRLR